MAALRLQTHVWNPTGTRRALLLHGLGSDGTGWWRLASQLAAADWIVVAPDLRGHGRSPTAASFHLDDLAADAVAIGDRWELVVGHSVGGAVAATLLDGRVEAEAAVLVDPVLQLTSSVRERLRSSLRAEAGGVAAEAVRAANPRWHERDVWRKVLATRQLTPDVVDAVLDDTDPWDLSSGAARWQARVELLAADPAAGDALLDAELAYHLAELPGVTAQVVAGAGHSIHRDAPEAVAEAVGRVAHR
ncbi:MAG: alpha/beta fold hydrolase [Nitriliruptoraceae bacterium]